MLPVHPLSSATLFTNHDAKLSEIEARASQALHTAPRPASAMRRARSFELVREPTRGLLSPEPMALVPARRFANTPELKPMDELRAQGASIREVHDLNPKGVNDCMVIVRESAGNDDAYVAFAVGQDSLAQASEMLRLGFRSSMREGRTKQLVMTHDAATAPLVEQLLQAVYFKEVEPVLNNALELKTLIDYMTVEDSPNPALSRLSSKCDTVLAAGLKRETAEGIFRRAVAVDNDDMQTKAIRLIDLNQEFRMRVANYTQKEVFALAMNGALKFAEPEPEITVMDSLWRWSQAHAEYPEMEAQAQLLRETNLVRCVRWVAVRDSLIWESLERGLLTDTDVGRIMRARALKISNRPEYASYTLFDKPIPAPRA